MDFFKWVDFPIRHHPVSFFWVVTILITFANANRLKQKNKTRNGFHVEHRDYKFSVGTLVLSVKKMLKINQSTKLATSSQNISKQQKIQTKRFKQGENWRVRLTNNTRWKQQTLTITKGNTLITINIWLNKSESWKHEILKIVILKFKSNTNSLG